MTIIFKLKISYEKNLIKLEYNAPPDVLKKCMNIVY